MTLPRSAGAAGGRVFLDANVLFSAAYRHDSGLRRLWNLGPGTTLLTSAYAAEEARRNLRGDAVARLDSLLRKVTRVADVAPDAETPDVGLPEKDQPILAAALRAGATHLLTGDRAHFGHLFGQRVHGMLIQRPAAYLSQAGG